MSDLDPGGHYIHNEPAHPHLPHCARCGAALVDSDGQDTDGTYVCGDWHGHDQHGVFAPSHDVDPEQVQRDDATYFVVCNRDDKCRFSEDADDWVIPYNPYTNQYSAIESLPATNATGSRDFGRGYAQAIRDVVAILKGE